MKTKAFVVIFSIIFINISYIFAQTDDYTIEISRKWVLSKDLIGFSIEVPSGVVKSLDFERTSWIQENVPGNAPIQVYKCHSIDSYGSCPPFSKAVYEVLLNELLQLGSVSITDESLTNASMILKAEILSDSLIRLSIENINNFDHGIYNPFDHEIL